VSAHAGDGAVLRRWGPARVALVGLDGFAALTAICGGIALAAGVEAARFPAGWLAGTPFSSYLLPGLILAAVVGGSAAVATIEAMRSSRAGGRASMTAGVLLLGWIVGEVVILTDDAEVISVIELVFLAVGLAMTALGARLVGRQRGNALDEGGRP
jgi:hypothetical protein